MSALKIDFDRLPRTVGIVGSRDFPKPEAVWEFVKRLDPETTIVSGGARGVDKAAENAARVHLAQPPVVYLPDPALPMPARFFARNSDIIRHVFRNRGIVFAFILEPAKTGGTQDSLNKCDKLGVPWVSFHMRTSGKWREPRVSPVIVQSLQWQEILYGSQQDQLIAY